MRYSCSNNKREWQKIIQDILRNILEFDSTNLANKVETLLNYFYKNKDLNQEKIRRHILKFDWQEVAKQHFEKVYKDLI